MTAVDVDGLAVRVKVSPGRVKAEYDDAAAVAARQGRPLRDVLAAPSPKPPRTSTPPTPRRPTSPAPATEAG